MNEFRNMEKPSFYCSVGPSPEQIFCWEGRPILANILRVLSLLATVTLYNNIAIRPSIYVEYGAPPLADSTWAKTHYIVYILY